EHSARNFVFPGSAAFSAAEKRDYEPCFAVRQQLLHYIVATAGPSSCAATARYIPNPTAPLPFPPRRVSVSAKEA
ncbi:hypothetical protein, partial [Burkholderia sp. AU32357]|uniref:hypothetical protein n=1 Tax=Burkholderia sp. AU32357 TaxID=2824811 RepID=UPI001BA32298